MGSLMSAPFYTYTWRVENFAYCFQNCEEELLSPVFEFDTSSRWQLRIYPRGKTPEFHDWISVDLVKCEGRDDIDLTWGCGIISTDGEVKQILNVENKFDNDTLSWGCNEFFRRSDLSLELYSQGGALAIQCVIKKFNIKNKRPILSLGVKENNNERMGITRIETQTFNHTCYKNITEKNISTFVKDSNGTTWLSVDVSFSSAKDVLVEIRKKICLSSLYCTCKLLIYESSGRMQHTAKYEHLFEYENHVWNINFTPKNYNSLQKKHITINLKLTVSTGITHSYTCAEDKNIGFFNLVEDKDLITEFKNDILEMYTNQTSSDFTLYTSDGTQFNVHKTILQARSPVFKSMFEHDTKERQENKVNIKDVDAETMTHVLKYIYSSDIEDIDSNVAMKVYAAADKYQLLTLKQHCNGLLRSKMNGSIVFKALKFAELHHDLPLEQTAIDFLIIHGAEAFKSNEWREFTKHDVQLSSEILSSVMKKVRKKRTLNDQNKRNFSSKRGNYVQGMKKAAKSIYKLPWF